MHGPPDRVLPHSESSKEMRFANVLLTSYPTRAVLAASARQRLARSKG